MLTLLPLLLAVPSPARADEAGVAADMACDPALPIRSIPAAGAVDVPTDAAIAVLFSDGCSSATWTFTLGDADGAVFEETLTVSGGLVELRPTLAPETAYTLEMVPTDGVAEAASVSFTTGDAPHVPHGALATITELAPVWREDGGDVRVDVVASLSGPTALDVFVRWSEWEEGLEGGSTGYGAAVAGEELSRSWVVAQDQPTAPDGWCVRVDVREADGSWNEDSGACAPVEVQLADGAAPPCGCATGGAAAPGLGALGLLAGAARRRRATPGA